MPAELIGFLGVAVLVIVTPGPDTALTIRNTLLGGRSGGIATASGWSRAGGLGAGHEPRRRRAPARLGAGLRGRAARGAAYLVFLGAQTLLAARRGGRGSRARTGRLRSGPGPRPARACQQPGEPEDGRLLPQPPAAVRPAGEPAFLPLLLLGLFCTMTLVWLTAYAVVVLGRRGSSAAPASSGPRGRDGHGARRARAASGGRTLRGSRGSPSGRRATR